MADPPEDLRSRVQYSLVSEMDIGIHCPEMQMIFRTRLASIG